MCYFFRQLHTADQLGKSFKAESVPGNYLQSERFIGFEHPLTPVIKNTNPNVIQPCEWGLIPFWAKDKSIQNSTLNARIETLTLKPSFKAVVKNRCLVLTDGFYEWQWLDPKGKQKQPFEITLPNNMLFAFAGIYSNWTDKATGEIISTFSIVTTEAMGIMAKIHNSKKRMPVILTSQTGDEWLNGKDIKLFGSKETELIATPI